MANGYERGDYLTQFLNQLPQIYRAKQSIDLQRERFQYMKDEGIKDDVYRGQVLTANQERNQLARDQFEQRQTQNQQDEAYRTATLENTEKTQKYNDFTQQYNALKGNEEGQEMLVKSMFKDNQQMVDTINENRDIKESMKQQVYSLDALPPEQRLLQARQLLSSPYLTKDLYETLTTITKGGKDELQFTLQDLKGTEFYPEYAKLATIINNPMPYLRAGQDVNAFLDTIGKQMGEIREKAFSGYKAGFGEYPTYDNVEKVKDAELDSLIADFSTPFTERYPFSPQEEGQISRAGGSLGFPISDKTQAPEEDITPAEEVTTKPKKITSLREAFAAGTPPKEKMALTGNVSHRVNEIYSRYKSIEKLKNVIAQGMSGRKKRGLKGSGKNEEYNQKQIDKLKSELKKLLSGVFDPSKKGLSDKFMEQYKQYGYVVPPDKREAMMKYLSELF